MMIQKIGKRMFRYNENKALVEYIVEATPDMYDDDKEWMEKYGHPLWGVDKDGYIVLDSVGLSRDHWDDVETRIMYLTEWNWDIDSDIEYMMSDYLKNEAGVTA